MKVKLDDLLDMYDSWAYDDFDLDFQSNFSVLLELRTRIHERIQIEPLDSAGERLLRELDRQLKVVYLNTNSAEHYEDIVRKSDHNLWWFWMDKPEALTESNLSSL